MSDPLKNSINIKTEQASKQITNTVNIVNTLPLHGSIISQVHYFTFNLFRIMKPLRLKYNVTINEIVFINACLLYHQHVNSLFSGNAMRLYVRYYNLNKFNYYLKSAINKELIMQSDIINGTPRYKITSKTIEILSQLQNCYNKALNDYCLLYGISL